MSSAKLTLRHRMALAPALIIAAAAGPGSLHAQEESSVARATLRGWEEQVRLAVFDRGGSFYGRTSDRGILQRFNELMDDEYDLDVISSMFSLTQTYSWYQRNDGARFWAGSIDHLQLVQQGDFKTDVALGTSWSAAARFTHDESLRTKRNLLWLGFAKAFSGETYRLFLRGTLTAQKPEADLEAGFTWQPGRSELTLAVAALDVFSDLVYQTLEVDTAVADTALDYLRHPFTARIALEVPLGSRIRAEAYGLVMTPTTVLVQSQARPSDGFEQDESYAYAGGLLEWEPSRLSAVGGFATWVRARLDRAALADGPPEDDFDLTESSWSLGLYAIHRFDRRVSYEGWVARVWRTEERVRPDTSVAPDVDYQDRTWAGRSSLIYRASSGFRGELGFDFTARWADGPAPVPNGRPLGEDNSRLRFDLGWEFGGRAMFMAGANLDVDAGRFDGAHGRFAFYW
jgi:hypothetical protein